MITRSGGIIMRRSVLLLGIVVVGRRCDAFVSVSPMAEPPPSSTTAAVVPASRLGRCIGGGSRSLLAAAAAAIDDLSKMTVAELKDELRKLNLTVGGRKSELIERLNDHYLSRAPMEISDTKDGDHDNISDAIFVEEVVSQSTQLHSDEEDLSGLTVPSLKERLRGLGLPVGGRKAELVDRLRGTFEDGEGSDEDERIGGVHTTEETESETTEVQSNNDGGDSILLGILDEILEDMDSDEESLDPNLVGDVDDIQLPPLDDDSVHSGGESAATRRARRKKYWKTQEVRELVRANDPRAASKAEEMISSLEQMAELEDDEDYLPGSIQYTLLIDSYVKRGTPDAIRKAEEVIDKILDAGEESNIKLSAQMLNAVMGAYANLGTVDSAEKATALLERMEYLKQFGGSVKPTVHSYSIAISAWAKTEGEAGAENAEGILNRLFGDYEEVLEEDGEGRYAEELRPNNVVFNSVIDAWARSGSPNAGEKAEALLHRMEVLSRMDQYNDVRPDTISFNTCIKACCNSDRPDAPQKAEEVLTKLETNPQYPKRSGGVLTVRPNRLSYNTVINAWAKSQQPESALRAEGLLLRMIKTFKSETFATITPDAVTFASVLNAIAKSRTVNFKAEKCSNILKAMIDLHEDDGSYDTKPNIICYNTLLNACAFSARGSEEEKRMALSVAVETFNQMRQGKYVSPDAVSYGNMLKCCANLMPPCDRRNAMASRLFASCCDEGLVGGMCLDEIRRCVPPRAFLPLLADCGFDEPMRQRRKAHSLQLRELPGEWTTNVKRGDMTQRQRASFAKPKSRQERRPRRRKEKTAPVIRRPGMVVEYGASGKDMM